MPQKLFTRRLTASFVDFALINGAMLLTVIFLHLFVSKQVVLPHLWESMECASVEPLSDDNMPQEGFAARNLKRLLPLGPGERYGLQYCVTKAMGITSYKELRFVTFSQSDGTITADYTNYFENENGDVVGILFVGSIQPVFSLFLLWFLTISFKTTPGKNLFSLGVVTSSTQAPKRMALFNREGLRLIPFMAIFAATPLIMASEVHLIPSQIFAESSLVFKLKPIPTIILLLIYVGIPLLFFWYIFGSFIRWKGATYWDRCAETKVVRTGKA